MTVRADIEATLAPEQFGLPDVARSIAAGNRGRIAGESSDALPELGIEEIVATLCDFVVAFRAALLELADRIDELK